MHLVNCVDGGRALGRAPLAPAVAPQVEHVLERKTGGRVRKSSEKKSKEKDKKSNGKEVK